MSNPRKEVLVNMRTESRFLILHGTQTNARSTSEFLFCLPIWIASKIKQELFFKYNKPTITNNINYIP